MLCQVSWPGCSAWMRLAVAMTVAARTPPRIPLSRAPAITEAALHTPGTVEMPALTSTGS